MYCKYIDVDHHVQRKTLGVCHDVVLNVIRNIIYLYSKDFCYQINCLNDLLNDDTLNNEIFNDELKDDYLDTPGNDNDIKQNWFIMGQTPVGVVTQHLVPSVIYEIGIKLYVYLKQLLLKHDNYRTSFFTYDLESSKKDPTKTHTKIRYATTYGYNVFHLVLYILKMILQDEFDKKFDLIQITRVKLFFFFFFNYTSFHFIILYIV